MFRIFILYFITLTMQKPNGAMGENSPTLLKFHQDDYQMRFERAELVRIDKKHVVFFEVKTFKYNRTWPVVNITYEYTIDVGNDVQVITQAYKFASNEYRLFPIRLQVNFCDAVSKDLLGIGTFTKCGNFSGCPMTKRTRYHYCNFAPDQARFPPYIPNGQYMLEFQGLFRSFELFVGRAYGVVSRPLAYN